MRLQSISARTGFAAMLLAALAGAAAAGGTRLGLWDVNRGYHVMAGAALLALFALAAGLLWLVLALGRNSGIGKRAGLAALVGAALLLYGPLGFVWRSLTMPPINDATTDTEFPPRFLALASARRPGESPLAYDGGRRVKFHGETATLSYLQHEFYPDLTKPTWDLLARPATMFWRGFESAKAMGWNIVSFDAKKGRIEAVATSLWFGRKTDIVIRVRAAGMQGARLDLRCQARDGLSDGTVACVRNFLKELHSR